MWKYTLALLLTWEVLTIECGDVFFAIDKKNYKKLARIASKCDINHYKIEISMFDSKGALASPLSYAAILGDRRAIEVLLKYSRYPVRPECVPIDTGYGIIVFDTMGIATLTGRERLVKTVLRTYGNTKPKCYQELEGNLYAFEPAIYVLLFWKGKLANRLKLSEYLIEEYNKKYGIPISRRYLNLMRNELDNLFNDARPNEKAILQRIFVDLELLSL
ncbi:MAG: hypothetical protein QXT45_07490 [Candidatus Bilamarchaeaceae archaeon]